MPGHEGFLCKNRVMKIGGVNALKRASEKWLNNGIEIKSSFECQGFEIVVWVCKVK